MFKRSFSKLQTKSWSRLNSLKHPWKFCSKVFISGSLAEGWGNKSGTSSKKKSKHWKERLGLKLASREVLMKSPTSVCRCLVQESWNPPPPLQPHVSVSSPSTSRSLSLTLPLSGSHRRALYSQIFWQICVATYKHSMKTNILEGSFCWTPRVVQKHSTCSVQVCTHSHSHNNPIMQRRLTTCVKWAEI